MNQDKHIAVIGAGRWGKNLTRNFHQLGVLHTLCDTDESHLNTFRKSYPDISITTQLDDVLNSNDITAVAIAAPSDKHFLLAKQALEHGKNLFVEKPLCLDSKEGRELVELANKKQAILMVGHLLHFHPYVRRLQNLVATGELGDIRYVVSNRLNLTGLRAGENALWDLAPHDISVIISLFGNRLPIDVSCHGSGATNVDVTDTSLTTLRFSADEKAHIFTSWMNPFKEQKLTVVGTNGMAVFDDTKVWDEKLSIHLEPTSGTLPTPSGTEPQYISVPVAEPLKEECIHFLDCCATKSQPITNGEEGLRVLKVLQAAQISLNLDSERIDPSMDFSVIESLASKYMIDPNKVKKALEVG